MTEDDPTPNKTIYVTDADQPLFERAHLPPPRGELTLDQNTLQQRSA